MLRYNPYYKYLENKFGCKVYKVSLNANFTCPNIDGTVGYGGCIYCTPNRSGEFGGDKHKSLAVQFNEVKQSIKNKNSNGKYLAYFQAGSNTYAPIEVLKDKYEQTLKFDDVVGLVIATRCDCLNDEIISYLKELSKRTYLCIELGLQTIHDQTAKLINRCHNLDQFDQTVKKLKQAHIEVVVHIINGLPYETKAMMLDTVRHLNKLKIDGIKIHMLFVDKQTKLYKLYQEYNYHILTKDEYVDIVCDQLEELNSNIIINRLTSDPNLNTLVEPFWLLNKKDVLNSINKCLKYRHTYQGFNKSILNKMRQILNLKVKSNDLVIDATMGQGKDTLYLANLVKNGHVFAFDIQAKAIKLTEKILLEHNINNVSLFLEDHQNMIKVLSSYSYKISAIIYNLGYLPHGNKSITTKVASTIKSITSSIALLNNKGFILIVCYPHEEGIKEQLAIMNLNIKGYKINTYFNTTNNLAPMLIEITKKVV